MSTSYTLEGATHELQACIDAVSDMVTHPSISFQVRTLVQEALDNLADAAEAMFFDEEADAYWGDALTQAERDGTYHLKPVVKSAAASADAINKAFNSAPDAAEKWWSRYTKRQVAPTGVRREVLTFDKHLDLGVKATLVGGDRR